MIRLLSVLFILAGIGFVGWGAMRYYQEPMASSSAKIDTVGATYEADTSASISSIDDAPTEYVGEAFESSASESAASESAMDDYSEDFSVAAAPAQARRMSREAASEHDEIVTTANAPQSMIDRLRTVPIAHETPTAARFNRSFEVTVAIDATGDTTAVDALPGTGNIVEGEAQVLDKAQATLSGSAFEIQLISPAIQTVSPVTENVWRWKVTPVETGTHELRIELFAMDGNEALPVRTFTDKVEVKVSRIGQFMAKADEFDPLFMILGGIGSLLAGLIGTLRFVRGK